MAREADLWAQLNLLPLSAWQSGPPTHVGPYLTTLQPADQRVDKRSRGYPVWSYWDGTRWGWATPHPEAACDRMTLLGDPANQNKLWLGLTAPVPLASCESLYILLYHPRK